MSVFNGLVQGEDGNFQIIVSFRVLLHFCCSRSITICIYYRLWRKTVVFYGFSRQREGRDGSVKILTVGYHSEMLEELKKDLTDIYPDAEIVKVTDSLMAGKYAFNHEVDIVFAESEMKRMNGIQLIQFVRQEHPGVKSFLIGSETELAESFLVESEDVSGILTYPLSEKSVREALQKNGA